MDEMEASITAMSFTSLMQRTHWFENPGRTTGETTELRSAMSDLVLVRACVGARVSPSLSDDSCVGSGVVLLLSVFWLQLDG